MDKPKVLFLIRKRVNYGISYGLVNSCDFLVRAFNKIRVESKIVEVVDGNSIDKEVYDYKPTHVFLEAIWVTPDKIRELLDISRYEKVQWFVRIHSNTPFLAHEGVALEWIKEYDKISKENKNFHISCNSKLLNWELNNLIKSEVYYTPNVYNAKKAEKPISFKEKGFVNIACFGALRPLKNQLEQAVSAILFAEKIHKKLKFHINSSRFENQGESILKNLRNLFKDTDHKLVEHEWMNHPEFLNVVAGMDIGMQCSFTETFNIVAADFVNHGIPLVGSKEIEWIHSWFQAHPTSSKDIIAKLETAYYGDNINLQYLNEINLKKYNEKSLTIWKDLLYNGIRS